MSQAYHQFLEAKVCLAAEQGLDVDPSEINPALKPHCRAMVLWALRGGRRALFASFGLHKTVMQLEICRIVLKQVGGKGLIVCPLNVRQEFVRDAVQRLGWSTPPKFVRTTAEMDADGIYLTNYESVREGKIDTSGLTVVSLDEASILRGFGGTKTFREFMAVLAGDDRRQGAATKSVGRRHGNAKPERVHRAAGLRGVPRRDGRRPGEDAVLQAQQREGR
jgi:hypothetical protein